MLDSRHETFLTLCACGSFTKTAKILHITQPAVSQHIRYLEDHYGCKLVDTSGRAVRITDEGEHLRAFAATVFSDEKNLKQNLQAQQANAMEFYFGVTLSIGEYVMPQILSRMLVEYPDLRIHMIVANTQSLLNRLNAGELNFIIVEGLFDKSEYDTTLFSQERFVPVCSSRSALAGRETGFEQIVAERLILRERGSGTREILEHILHKRNYSLHSFKRIIEIGNMSAIKEMVSRDLGLTFLFQVAAARDLADGRLVQIDVPGLEDYYEFNFVMLKNSFYKDRYMQVFDLLQTFRDPANRQTN